MTATLAVLRPEPGNAATVARAEAAGFTTLSLPLFAVRAISWDVPDIGAFDALILTSANAVRFAGEGLANLLRLPVLAVGPHTAAAARATGFDVMATGGGDGAAIAALATDSGISRALHLTGRDRTLVEGGPIRSVVPVYENAPLPIAPAALEPLIGTTALLHSARAAHRLGALIDAAHVDRNRIAIAAFSTAIAAAAGTGWADIASATAPDDAALFVAARDTASRADATKR